MHDPSRTAEAAEGRRLGGIRRRREKTIEHAYNFKGFRTIDDVLRYLDIAGKDALGLENSVGRTRAMTHVAATTIKAFEMKIFDERIKALEAVVANMSASPGRRL